MQFREYNYLGRPVDVIKTCFAFGLIVFFNARRLNTKSNRFNYNISRVWAKRKRIAYDILGKIHGQSWKYFLKQIVSTTCYPFKYIHNIPYDWSN